MSRGPDWPARVAAENSIEDLLETYRLLFPGKRVTPVVFGNPEAKYDVDMSNRYARKCSAMYGVPSLLLTMPEWSGERVENEIREGGHMGCKVYLNYAPPHIRAEDITIFDYLPRHQLEVLDRNEWVAMLHIPRPGRLKDAVNLAQMIEIEQRYPGVKLIIAHVGRAYCPEDVGDAFGKLATTSNMMFDFSANTNQTVFEKLIVAVGPKRILFGSDLPITRMRMRRICENGNYVNLVPSGLYGDVSSDRHMREADPECADTLTFFLYEQINAFLRASERLGLSAADIEDIFYRNAARLFGLSGGKP